MTVSVILGFICFVGLVRIFPGLFDSFNEFLVVFSCLPCFYTLNHDAVTQLPPSMPSSSSSDKVMALS